ncbi:ABC transporter ATP-binding protein [Clostridium paraputrificum]|uniref:ABC transporter ATP-binding protein n=1 Tax=Clostridium TaxID=1485 RepID=UPI000666480A|nr:MULTISPECIES: ABC transporter ATP-binding protein [Clostridium]MBS7130422.1 ABC transporter ATP-binding protein [Clostridium sp.]MDB2075826.1 ABC transporter ATP-binding protein [Clostridium paraputrificum]MDB2078810.1 ABC transporter ATP-binding protein [Clostridium paraputrificum]MDB2092502.1 ABC transporter ATP-binding protein [Clostridium paraputrificum]MDB2100753.1 ABC transporter ATP-binding protein [Clostridium paraputrificum]
MLKLLKYLKKSIVPILVIVLFLIGQAVCDLSLPDYTSKVVNVGIQQGGVENPVPDVIRASEMDKLMLLMEESDKNTVLSNYNYLDKASLSDKDLTGDEPIYELNTKDKTIIEELSSIFGKPMLVVKGFENDSEETKKIKEEMLANLPPQMIQNGDVDMFEVFSLMPKENLSEVRKTIDEKFSAMPDSIITQSAISYVRGEYENLGINTDKLQTNYMFLAGAKMLGIALLSAIATIVVGFLGARVAATLGRNLRSKVFNKVMSFSNTEMDKFSTASLITRSTNDIQQVQMLMVMMLRVVIYSPIIAIGGIIKVTKTNTSMTWIIAVAVIAILSLVMILFIVVMPKFKVVQTLVDRVNLVTREILTGIPVIRAFSTQKYEEKRFDKANLDLTKTNIFVNRVMACMMPAMMLVMNGISVLIMWNGAHGVDSGAMQVGDMMAFIQYTMQIIMSFLMISAISIMLPRAAVCVQRVDEVISTDLIIEDKEQTENFKEDKKGYIEFNNVSFKYPNAEEDVLSDISFVAKPGETTAFIGSTGSGKSTLINLIPRFYDVTEGSIKVDGVDVRNVSQHDLREKIGYVPQKGILFSGTIDSNLRYGREEATDVEIVRAAEIAQAIDFISSKPERFETEISQGGTNVSGGQKQRLSIARAIAKNPEIYIFDDSFSALDFKTDSALRKALKQETSDSTVLIVAQRISTILHADQIIVLDEGKVVGKGTHNELLKNCEVYKQIALSQLSKEELENEQ